MYSHTFDDFFIVYKSFHSTRNSIHEKPKVLLIDIQIVKPDSIQ